MVIITTEAGRGEGGCWLWLRRRGWRWTGRPSCWPGWGGITWTRTGRPLTEVWELAREAQWLKLNLPHGWQKTSRMIICWTSWTSRPAWSSQTSGWPGWVGRLGTQKKILSHLQLKLSVLSYRNTNLALSSCRVEFTEFSEWSLKVKLWHHASWKSP